MCWICRRLQRVTIEATVKTEACQQAKGCLIEDRKDGALELELGSANGPLQSYPWFRNPLHPGDFSLSQPLFPPQIHI